MPNLDKDFYLDKQGLRQLINELETNIVALEYDTTVSYAVGQYCVYENNFYRCTTATTGAWDSNDWVKVVISDEIPTIHSITTAQWEALTPAQKASGDYVITDATTVPLTAENVPYDNTDSGLTADNVQEALDELSTSTNVDADDVNYDNTTSGLTADNVQDAIDELSQSSGASSVAQLEDVQLSNLSDNDLLVYDSNLTGGKLWKNAKKIVTCTKAQFDAWSVNNSFPYTDCKYIVTDVNNLNTTSADIPYDSTGTASVWDKVEGKANTSDLPTASIISFDASKWSSKTSNREIRINKYGKVVSMYIVFTLTSALSANEGIISNGGVPPMCLNQNEYQFLITCVAGTNAGKTGRVRITKEGGITDWYSQSGFFASGCTFLMNATYITD